jgi:hypothetical protein
VACNIYGSSEIPTVLYYEGHLFQVWGDFENGYMVKYCQLKSDEIEEFKKGDVLLEVDVFAPNDIRYKIFKDGARLRSDRSYILLSVPVFHSVLHTAMRIVNRRENKECR